MFYKVWCPYTVESLAGSRSILFYQLFIHCLVKCFTTKLSIHVLSGVGSKYNWVFSRAGYHLHLTAFPTKFTLVSMCICVQYPGFFRSTVYTFEYLAGPSCRYITRGQLWPSGIIIACVCLCVRVRQSSVCPDENLSPAPATITKIGPEVQNILVKVQIVFGVHWPWPSRSNWT